ncbi:MAG TPA: hypothetical protein VF482_14540 [Trebonia sp.]
MSAAPVPAAFRRTAEALDHLSAEVLDLRIWLAQQRDGMLTEAEQIAVLDVYGEFGR